MKARIILILALFALLSVLTLPAGAQTLTSDLVFLKVGYIPVSVVDYQLEGTKDPNQKGLAVQGEYNLNLKPLLVGFGVEYQRLRTKDFTGSGDKNLDSNFIQPMLSLKFATDGGFYIGGGISGKYLMSAYQVGPNYEFTKKMDAWANGILGFYFPVSEGVYLDLEGRFGYNLTKKQYSEIESATIPKTTTKQDINANYDIAVYFGIGFRAFSTNM